MKNLPARQWDWISAGLLFILLQVPAARLVTTDWAPYLYWVETMAGFGAVLGLALGRSSFRPATALVLAAGYTAAILPWQLTRAASDDLLLDRLNRVGWILAISTGQFFQRQPVKDSLFFVSLVCLAFWLMGVFAGYWLSKRGRVMGAIAVSGAAIIVIQSYANYQARGSWWVAVFIFVALLLVGRAHFLHHRNEWLEGRVFVSEDAGANLLGGLFTTVALAILIAWWLPSAPGSVQGAADTWNTYIQPIKERLSNAVTSLRGPYGRPSDNFYGRALDLGQNAAEGDAVVLRVEVVESPGLNVRYYWRGRIYNEYDGSQWSESANSKLLVHPDSEELGITDPDGRSPGQFRITSEFPVQTLIYGPASPVWLDRTADVTAVRAAADEYDVVSFEARSPMAAGAAYQMRSLLRNPDIEELRSAGEDYPAWVSQQYLGIPERDTSDLRALALEITQVSTTNYDRAFAITSYLRNAIEYSTNVPAAPEGRDPVIWVLFDFKKGFCNYYASAEVLLLRSIGIPARLAVGFARGSFDAGEYTVHRRDAHAWPEVFFPGIGWVEFEPTSNQDPLIRPSGLSTRGGVAEPTSPTNRSQEEQDLFPQEVEIGAAGAPLPFHETPAGRAVLTALPILAGLAAIILARRLRLVERLPAFASRAAQAGGGPVPAWIHRWERWYELEPIERVFATVRWSLRLLGEPAALDATPAAQAAALSRLIPKASKPIATLREDLETSLFTAQLADLGRARRAAAAVALHAIRARVQRLTAALGGHAVYSDRAK